MSQIKKAFIVSHVHWDREWYLTMEQFRVLLLETVDRLLDILENDSSYSVFMFDGQTIALEDYLDIHPEKTELIQKHVRSGRLLIGPWYVLPDEFLISSEGHIRNYLEGRRFCGKAGGNMNLGYLPDSFGHPSQMPAVLKGLGLNEIIFWRGLGNDVSETEIIWRGLDGTEIPGINMPFSYGIAACLPQEPGAFAARLQSKIDLLSPLTRTGSVLLMQGVDHTAPMRSLPQLLDSVKDQFDCQLIHGSLSDYLDEIRGEIKSRQIELQRTDGELRSGWRAYLLGGTLSSRMYLKQQNERCENRLFRYAEPLSALSWFLGISEYPQQELRHALRLYLVNMPHDSICGCSVDAVHREMMTRCSQLEDFTGALEQSLVKKISAQIPGTDKEDGSRVLLFNPLTAKRSDPAEMTLVWEKHLLRKVNYENGVLEESEPCFTKPLPSAVLLRAADGREMKGIRRSFSGRDILETSLDTQPEMYRIREGRFYFPQTDFDGLGLSLWSVRWLFDSETGDEDKSGNSIENNHYCITARPEEGGVCIDDKLTGEQYRGCLRFEDLADAGDEYTYSPLLDDHPVGAEFSSVSTKTDLAGSVMTIRGELILSESLSADRQSRSDEKKSSPFVTTLTLSKNSRRIDCVTELVNNSNDHRLRLLFPVGGRAPSAQSEGIFSVDERPLSGGGDYSGWVEPPSAYPQKGFSAVRDGKRGMMLLSRGLPECEYFHNGEEGTLALTLLRCVGWLSRPDLTARKGNGGWTLPVPEAQCLGAHVFEYSMIFQGDGELTGTDSDLYACPVSAYQIPGEGWAPEPNEFFAGGNSFAVDSPYVRLSAFKQSEDSRDLVIRLQNASSQKRKAVLSLPAEVQRVVCADLKEERETEQAFNGPSVPLKFKAWEIKTLKIRRMP